MQQKNTFPRRVVKLVASPGFFRLIVGVLVLQAAWIALSGRYPMAFDEDFHLGIIRLYAHHLSPFWSSQPPGADVYGAVARDPSYLYQYLMSFPYRLVSALTHDQTIQVLVLRGLNIALLAGSLPLYRRLLLKTGASRALVHTCLALLVLIPIVPFLAAQINYDNLLLPLTALVLLVAVNFAQELRQYKRINTERLIWLMVLCLLGSLVKYAFLPIALATFAYLAICLRQTYAKQHKFWLSLGFGLTLMTRRTRGLLLILLVISLGMFAQRYGVNLVRYHTPVPACSKVLSVKQCSAYGPWIRDYNFAINKVDEEHSPFVFTADWLNGMWLRLFFAVGGPNTDFETRGPLPVPAIGAIVFAGLGVVVSIGWGRRVLRRYDRSVLGLFGLVSAFYIAVLWLDEYQAYVRTGQPVAINGRYLLPVILLLFVFVGLACNEALRKRRNIAIGVATLAIFCLLWGGGVMTFILRSNDAWYWPNHTVQTVNYDLQHALGPLTPGYKTPTEFLR